MLVIVSVVLVATVAGTLTFVTALLFFADTGGCETCGLGTAGAFVGLLGGVGGVWGSVVGCIGTTGATTH